MESGSVSEYAANDTFLIKLLFLDEKTRDVRIVLPQASPSLHGTVIYNHAMEYYCIAHDKNNRVKPQKKNDTINIPPLRVDALSDIYPYILPLWREGAIL